MTVDLRTGDSLEILKTLDANSIDSVVTDPPYGLSFMGKKWDYDVPTTELWKEVLRVLKPGGHLLSFSSSRTYHRMTVNVEDAGFEIRDQIMWVYGSGFPKSHNIGKSYDKKMGNLRESLGENPNKKGRVNNSSGQFAGAVDNDWKPRETTGTFTDQPSKGGHHGGNTGRGVTSTERHKTEITKGFSKHEGWGTALKPSHEPIVLARKPLSEKTVVDNVIKWGTGGINIDKSRVGTEKVHNDRVKQMKNRSLADNVSNHQDQYTADDYERTYVEGRFPANFIHDGSDEVTELFPQTAVGIRHKAKGVKNSSIGGFAPGYKKGETEFEVFDQGGSAARYFYCAKVSKAERNAGLDHIEKTELTGRDPGQDKLNSPQKLRPTTQANNHPTVKPVKLMSYLVNLVTPVSGTVLDPFMGSGSTGLACKQEGFDFIGIDLDESYVEIAKARIDGWKNL